MADEIIPDPLEGPGKGKPFFDRAKTVAESGNYDYAIDMIVEGLKREPQNIVEHEKLRNIALTRKIKGGKSGGGTFGFGGAKAPMKGKTPKDLMLNAEFVLAKDPGNIPEMMKMLRAAIAGSYFELALWVAKIAGSANKTTKNPKMDVFTDIIEMLQGLQLPREKKIDALNAALQVLSFAKEIKPDDMDLQSLEKDVAANIVLARSYQDKEDDFKSSLKSQDDTNKLLQEDSLIKSDPYKLKLVAEAKAEYEKNPREHQLIQKYGKALADTEIDDLEEQAIQVYMTAFKDTKTYRYKSQADDIRIKQVQRNYRLLREALKHDPTDETTIAQVKEIERERLELELEVFAERVEHYPTEITYQFEYGRRLFVAKRFNDAIQAFQFAQNNPKYRAEALHLMGRCFKEQGMKPEATDTLKRAIDEYEYAPTGDTKSKEYHYQLALMYEDTDHIQEAIDIYSKIMQWDFNYRDARQRLEKLRKSQ